MVIMIIASDHVMSDCVTRTHYVKIWLARAAMTPSEAEAWVGLKSLKPVRWDADCPSFVSNAFAL